MEGAWYESLRIEGLQKGEEDCFREEWERRTVERGKLRECPVDVLEEMMMEERWKKVRAKVVREERENKHRGEKFLKMKKNIEGAEDKEEVITILSSEDEIEVVTLDSEEEEEPSGRGKAERCPWCKSYGCRGADTARKCLKCGYLALKCWADKHQKWCKAH